MDDKKQPEAFARPVAQQKDSNSRAWLAFLSLLCFAVALWQPIKRAWWGIRNRMIEQTESSIQRDADSFVAISFEGVSKEKEPTGRFILVDRLREHLEALRSAGYHPISLKDVRDFYLEGRLLPSKAVLLTFENAHKSTYFDAAKLLRSMRWHATMGVVTRPVRDWDDDVLLRPYLKDMALDATWDLASESDNGTSFIPSDSHGGTQPFFSTRQWIDAEKRYETLAEFDARIEEDHARAMEEFTNHVGVAPQAFFFPNGNYGQFGNGNWALREANLDAVDRHYRIGFILNNKPLNTRGTDPRRLNRLSVPADWTADRLLRELDLSWPVVNRRAGVGDIIGPERWQADWGLLHKEEDGVTLLARPADDPRRTEEDATGGARAWITGSNLFTEGMLDLRFVLVRGEVHVYLRFVADDDYLRFALSDTGHTSLSRCSPGGSPETLAETGVDASADFRTTHRLLLTLRDGLLFARLDGKSLFEGPISLGKEDLHGGLVGVGVWDPSPGLATIHLLETHMRARLDGMAVWPASLSRDQAYIARVLGDDAYRFAFIAPPWLDVYEASPIAFQLPEESAMSIVAGANRTKLYPCLTLHAEASLDSLPPTRLVTQLRTLHADGVFFDANELAVSHFGEFRTYLAMLEPLLTEQGLGLVVRVPQTLQRQLPAAQLATDLPALRLANESGEPPPGIPPQRMVAVLRLTPPLPGEIPEQIVQIDAGNAAAQEEIPSDDTPEGRLYLRAQGLRAFSDGEYSTAVEYWSKWAESEPDSAEAWAFLGNGWNRMRDSVRAVEAYRRSLAIEPGQIDLALECARLLETSGRDDEGADMIDTYARAYPDNRRIAVAQALWMDRHGRRPEGRAILRKLVQNDPSDIPCRLTLQSLLDTPADRYGNMHELLGLVTGGGDAQLLGFGHDLAAAELLTIPESTVFFDFIRHTATNALRPAVRELYSSFLPFSESIVEDFDASRLSDRWITLGTPLSNIVGSYDLKAASNMAEAYLRLKNSELMRDGFIEVTLGESVGAFWLYARRSSRNMVRFGFDGDGFLRIQTWSDGEPLTMNSRAWIRPAGDIIVRLEVRGDGAIGLVNGKPVFSTPLSIPSQIAYGWWSVAPFSPELGIARARISRIATGPMRPGIAMLRETDPERAADALDRLFHRVSELSAIAPVLFVQHPDGTLLPEPMADLMPFRMFCSYHRLRLMPVAALDYFSDVRAETLVEIIKKNRLAGLVLQMRSMPSESWIAHATELLEQTDADLIIVQSEAPIWPTDPPRSIAAENDRLAAIPPVAMRELERGSLLLSPIRQQWQVPVIPFDKWVAKADDTDTVSPILVVIPTAFEETAEEPAEAEKAPAPTASEPAAPTTPAAPAEPAAPAAPAPADPASPKAEEASAG